jgi:predicted aspartyl protease
MQGNDDIKLATGNLTKFDGKGDFEVWYRKFVASADAWNVKDGNRYKALVLVLDQDVLTRIMAECREAGTLPDDRTEAWLAAELRKRFAYEKTILKRFQEFLERKIQKGETLEGYLVVKRQLYLNCMELWKVDKSAVTDNGSLFLEAAIEGLPKALQATVKLKHPPEGRKFEELLKSARDLQGSEGLRAEGRAEPSKPSAPPTSPSKSTASPRKQPRCFECGEKGHFKWQCPKLKEEMKRGDSKEKSRSQGAKEGAKTVLEDATGVHFMALELGSGGRSLAVKALVDTGAQTTVIARRIAEKLSKSGDWQEQARALRTANGTPLKVLGKLPVTLRLGRGVEVNVKATVAEDVEDSLLLGNDVYEKLGADISYRQGGLVLPDGALLPWTSTGEEDAPAAKVSEPSQSDGRAEIERV